MNRGTTFPSLLLRSGALEEKPVRYRSLVIELALAFYAAAGITSY